MKAKPFSLAHTRWANASSIPYKPKELETLVQRNRKRKMYVDDHLMIRWYNDISLVQCFTQKIGNKITLKTLRERKYVLDQFHSYKIVDLCSLEIP